jgi:exosortase/archaeosortase family protein
MKMPPLRFPKELESLKGLILFFFILMAANLFWKYNVQGDEAPTANSLVTFWGLDISAPFVMMADHVARVSAAILHFFGSEAELQADNILRHPNGHSAQIIWACTGLKQAYICFCIIAFSRGPWSKKLWFIPLTLLVVYLFNIFRITVIVACINRHPDWFNFLHLYAFKYVFYGIIFLMWIFWEEKIVNKEQPKDRTTDSTPAPTQTS